MVATTDPPLISIISMAAARKKHAALVNWLQDIYPELAAALGVPFLRGPATAALTAVRNRSLRFAAANVAVGRLMGQKLVSLGVPAAHVHVIANWCDDQDIRPLQTNNPLRQSWRLDGKFVVGYSGNLGRVHEFKTILETAERLRSNAQIVFLMIGGGKLFEELRRAVAERYLTSFRFLPYQERKLLAQSLGAADVHWLSSNPKLEGLILPSKFYGIAAAGRPIIVIGDRKGELAELVEHYACGIAIAAGDVGALTRTLLDLSSSPSRVTGMGLRSREMLEEQFTRQHSFRRWDELLGSLDTLGGTQGTQWT
jgi:glycosyltransferase involved in cell wall biosynthesis